MRKSQTPKQVSVMVLAVGTAVSASACGSPSPSADAGDNPCPPHCGPIQDRDGGYLLQPDGGLVCFC